MDAYSYKQFAKKGDKAQELLIGFMESVWKRKFVAGDRNGETINIDLIEEVARCSYIAPNTFGRHGPRLAFFGKGKPKGQTMPDELFLVKASSKYEFIDVKNRTKNTLREEYWKIDDYAKIEIYSGIPTFVVVVIWNPTEKDLIFLLEKLLTS